MHTTHIMFNILTLNPEASNPTPRFEVVCSTRTAKAAARQLFVVFIVLCCCYCCLFVCLLLYVVASFRISMKRVRPSMQQPECITAFRTAHMRRKLAISLVERTIQPHCSHKLIMGHSSGVYFLSINNTTNRIVS